MGVGHQKQREGAGGALGGQRLTRGQELGLEGAEGRRPLAAAWPKEAWPRATRGQAPRERIEVAAVAVERQRQRLWVQAPGERGRGQNRSQRQRGKEQRPRQPSDGPSPRTAERAPRRRAEAEAEGRRPRGRAGRQQLLEVGARPA